MKLRILASIILAAMALTLILAGPRPNAHVSLNPPLLPDNLDEFLLGSESRFTDLIPDTNKNIVWHDPLNHSKTDLAIVYLHGFSATRQEVKPLPEQLARRLGANLYYNRFKGHGRSEDALGETTVSDWLQETLEAVAIGRRLGEKVIVMGTSTGGTAATWFAANQDQSDLMALVLISPNYGPANPSARILLWPWGLNIARLVNGDYYSWNPVNVDHGRFWTTRFPTRALVPMMQLVDLTENSDLEGINIPILAFYSPQDRVVDVTTIGSTFARFGSHDKQLTRVVGAGDPAQHVLAGDILSPQTTGFVADTTIGFLLRQ